MRNISQEDGASATIDVSEEDILRVSEIIQENKLRQSEGLEEGLEETVDELTLSIWDFAGQNIYYITHSVFLVPRAIYVLCFNLCCDLNKSAEGGEKVIFCEHHMTNLEVIIFWLRSIYTNTTENQPTPGQKQLSPSVFIAGTHRESLPGNAEERQALAEKQFAIIKEALKGKPYQGHVVSKYYAIDNSLRSPLDPSIVELRDHITEVAKNENYLKEEFPIKWLHFWHEIELLRINQTRLLNFNEVEDLAVKCGIIEKELLFASLHLYHDLGDIFYYGKLDTPKSALNDIIILDPQWLICIFSSVFTVNVSSNQYSQYQSSWERLDDHGILEENLIKHMWREFLDHFEYLLELMEKFDLLCLKTQSDEMPADIVRSPEKGNRLFYVPSLLKNQSVVCKQQPMASKSMFNLYIDFDGFLPEGIFYRLVVRLVEWSQKQKGNNEPELFYQQAILDVDENHEMILRILPEKRTCIEVTIKIKPVESDSDEDDEEDVVELYPATCKIVWKLLKKHLHILRHTWMKRISYDFYILCKVCKENTDLHKLEKCLSANKYVTCSVKGTKMKIKRIKFLFGKCSATLDIPHASLATDKMVIRHPPLASDTHHTEGATPHPSSATGTTHSSSTTDTFHPSSFKDKHPSSCTDMPKHTVPANQTQEMFDIQGKERKRKIKKEEEKKGNKKKKKENEVEEVKGKERKRQVISEDDYNDLLKVVSDWWKSHGGCTGIHMMKILLRQFKEKIGEQELQETNDIRALFNLLEAIGVASSSNHEVILEAVKICSLKGVEKEIRKIKPTFENFNFEDVEIKTFSFFRRNLIKFGKNLLTEDIVNVGHLCQIPEHKHKSPWLLIFALEDKKFIQGNSAEKLIERLKRNQMDHYAAIFLESPS